MPRVQVQSMKQQRSACARTSAGGFKSNNENETRVADDERAGLHGSSAVGANSKHETQPLQTHGENDRKKRLALFITLAETSRAVRLSKGFGGPSPTTAVVAR